MAAAFAVADDRDSASWNQARRAVCAILTLTESLFRRNEHRKLATNIKHLSLSALANIARGFERSGDRNFLMRAANTIEQFEQELKRAQQRGVLNDADAALLKENFDAVKKSLEHLRP